MPGEFGIMDINRIVEIANSQAQPRPQTETLASLSADEVRAINERIAEIAENEEVFAVLWNAREDIYDIVRAVKKKNPGSEFKGMDAEGDDLDLILVRPQDIKKTGTALTSWIFSATAGTDYFESDTNDANLQLAEDEGRVYCGWADPIDSPKAVGVQFNLPGISKIVPLNFDLSKDYPIIQHKPVKILPKVSYSIQVRYKATGTDALRPIAVYATKAANLSL